MGMQFGVHVVDGDDNPVEGAEVTVYFSEDNPLSDLLKGGTSLEDFTDEDGHVGFETAFDHHDQVVIRCRGERYGPYDLEDGADYTINV